MTTQETFAATQLQIDNAWYVAGLSPDFEREALQQRVITQHPIVMWRDRAGEVVAFDDRCCHKRMPLSAGRFLEDGSLECAYHGLCFDSGGRCVRIPSQPDLPIPARARLRQYPVVEQQGVVWIWPGDPALIGDVQPPPTPEIVDPAWEHVTGSFTVKANSVLMIENLLDTSHFYPLHAGNIGKSQDSNIPMRVDEGEIRGCRYVRVIREVDGAAQSADFADLLGYELADSHSMQTLVGPGIVFAERTLWPAGRKGDESAARKLRNLHMLTPIDVRTHIYRWVVNMPKGQMSGRYPDERAVDRAREVLKQTFAEDIWALEKQQEASEFPDRGFEEMFLRSDAAITRSRRILQAMQQRGREAPGASGSHTTSERKATA